MSGIRRKLREPNKLSQKIAGGLRRRNIKRGIEVLSGTMTSRFSRVAIGVYLALWVAVIVGSWIYWNDMSFWFKSLVVALEVLFIPDVASVREVFSKADKRG